ncbi:hypothetical protein C1894_27835 [Pseudomonas sp. FW305-3-2-15-E-TSA2]|nr:hypothetical protein C1894_27835 [Pseudomonas sp. FW305-3-2-15-E-TSA2]
MSLLAIAVAQSVKMLTVPPSSRAGPLLQVPGTPRRMADHHTSKCGSEPAREECLSVNTDVV